MEKPERIGVVDYGGGNLRNVLNVLAYLEQPAVLISGPSDFQNIDRLVFPGVGSFGDCVTHLDQRKLRDPLVDWIQSDRPFFGICLGYQILFESSAETPDAKGLGVFAGEVVRFQDSPGLKVPHMGWNAVEPVDRSFYFWKDTLDPLYLYFVHSFYPSPEESSLIASHTNYGENSFASSVCKGNLFAGQFHPERSQEAGLQLMRNFLESH